MAGSIVSLGVEKLWKLVSQENERFQGVEEQITELKGDLNMLMAFLYDADAKKQTSALARNCLEDIKEITFDAEDIIEIYLLKGRGIKSNMKSLACIPGGRRDIALEITGISERISKVIQVMQSLGIKSDIMNGGYSLAQLERKRETRHTFPIESETNLVGLEKNVEKLVEELVGNDSSLGVSITGLGGLGKTTLARQVFNHDNVKVHFDGLAWVCVSQDFTRKYVWETILKNLSHGDYVADMKEDKLHLSLSHADEVYDRNISQRKKISDMNEDELQEKLIQLLETKKALIVFDDVWKSTDWDTIKRMFPERKAGWKVLLTSRNDDVHPQCVTFKPEGLTLDECWKLLQMIAFPKNGTTGYIIDKDMVEMAKEMIKNCGGLPLAVKVLGGLLAAQHTPRQWKMISENIKLRSLLFIPVGNDMRSNFMELPLLRILDLRSAKFEGGKLPSSIGKLIHLKYLSLYGAHVTHLPSSLRNLKSLLYLNLNINCYPTDADVPNVLKEMLELRYLCLPWETTSRTKLELGNLLKLEMLKNFSTEHSSVTDLHRMTRLRSLHIIISGEGWRMETLSLTLRKLGHLEDLTIQSPWNSVLSVLLKGGVYLKHPKLLPDVQHFPSHLTTISLDSCRLEEDPMPILEKLLQLKEVSLWQNAYVGRGMVCSSGGFPQLHKLSIGILSEWEEWKVEEGSMPLLHSLTIHWCPKLKELPDGLRFFTSLKELTIKENFRRKFPKEEKITIKIQHIPLIEYDWPLEPEDIEVN